MHESPGKKQLDKLNKELKRGHPSSIPFVKIDVRDRKKGWTYILKYSNNRVPSSVVLDTQDLFEARESRKELQDAIFKAKARRLEGHRPKKTSVALDEISKQYLGYRKKTDTSQGHGTWRSDRDSIRSLLNYVDGKTRVSDITVEDVLNWQSDYGSTVATATVNHHLRHLKSFGSYLVKIGLIQKSPFHGVSQLRNEDTTDRLLSEATLKKLFKEASKDKYDHNLAKFVYYSGCRISEALSLTWDRVDLKSSPPTVVLIGKGKRSRKLPLIHGMLEPLESQKKIGLSDQYVFPYRNFNNVVDPSKPANRYSIRTRWRNRFEKAGVDQVRWHWLRHTRLTQLGTAGMPLKTLMLFAGHTQASTAMKYQHPDINSMYEFLKTNENISSNVSAKNNRNP